MEVEDSNLLTLYQIPPLCQDLEPAFTFIREQVKKGLRCTVMVKRPVDISARVEAAMEKRRKNLEKIKSPEEILAEKREEVQQLLGKAEQAKEESDYIKAAQTLLMALNLNPEEDTQVHALVMVRLCQVYELLDEVQQLIEYQDKTIRLLKELNLYP